MESSETEVLNARKRRVLVKPSEESQEIDSGKASKHAFSGEESIHPKTRNTTKPTEVRDSNGPSVKRQSSKKSKKGEIEDTEKYAMEIVTEMRESYKKDLDALINKKPSTTKIDIIDSICFKVLKKEAQEACVKLGVLDEIRVWLEPLPDNSLPNPKIKRALLNLLKYLRIERSDLSRSGIGKIVHFYSKNNRETKEIRSLAEELMKKWKRIVLREEMEE